jgi:hypothetical protein
LARDETEAALSNEGRKAGLRVVDDDGAPIVRIDADLNRTARDFGEVARKLDIYELNEELVYFDASGRMKQMHPQRFRTWINGHVVVCRKFGKESGQAEPSTLEVQEAGAVLESEAFRRAVRVVERINRVRLPVLREEQVEWLPWGYDEEAHTYTVPGGIEYDHEMPLAVAKGWFERHYGSFPYYDDRSKAVQLTAMLAPFVRHLMPAGCLRKGFLWKANKSDSGKSIAAKSALYPVMGSAAAAKMKRREELDKEIEGFVRSAAAYIFLDNVYGGIASATLDQLVTSKELIFRGMGGHGMVRAKFEGLLMVTGNDLESNEDAARRFLLVDLFAEDDPAERVIREPMTDDLMESARWRGEALAVLCALVRNWDDAGRPTGPTIDRTFPDFTGVLGGIVTAAGFADPIKPPAKEESLTPDQADFGALLRELLREMEGERQAERVCTLEDLARLARAHDLFGGMIGTEEQGKKLVIKEDGVKGDERAMVQDLGYLTPSQRQKWNGYLMRQVGQKPRVGDQQLQFGSRAQRRKTQYTVTVL